MIRCFVFAGLISFLSPIYAQDELIKKVINNASVSTKFEFSDVLNLPHTPVKNQGSAGTCWSYSGNSFLESEMVRMGKTPVDIAEIFTARYVYLSKARNYILFNGNLGLGDGGETHDVLTIFKKYGAMPQEAYLLEDYGKGKVKSDEFQQKFKAILDAFLADQNPEKGAGWVTEINAFLDKELGAIPSQFTYQGKTYSPKSFAKEVIGINPADYLEFSSYQDAPYHEKIVLPVPDNWSYDLVYNVPMTELTDIIDYALSKGYSVAWSSDVSEKYFSWKNGLAFVPDLDLHKITDEQRKNLFSGPAAEKEVTEDLRLTELYALNTTDDHAMQIVGLAKDQTGKQYYKVKNSWGATNDYQGYLYVTKAFVQLKSTGILLHKEGVPKTILKKLK